MKITTLLERAGDALKTQRLDTSLVAMRQRKGHAEVTFSTEKAMASQLAKSAFVGAKADFVGIVVWIPSSAWKSDPREGGVR